MIPQTPAGATPLSMEEAAELIPTHIVTREQLNRLEQENISAADEWLFKRRRRNLVSAEFIRLLHKRMYGNVWKWAGKYRGTEKNIGVEAWRIAPMLQDLCADVRYWIEHNTYEPDPIAARFHHRLVFIHPFANGNGRHARLITDALLIQQFECPRFTWGSASLLEPGEYRARYIAALQAADRGDYSLLLSFVRS
jgi:Fic-DOC domain mobile mystery protein B